MSRNLYFLFLAAVMLCVPVSEAKKPQRNLNSIKKEQRATEKAIKLTAEQIEANTRKTNHTLNQLNALNAEIREHEHSINTLASQVNAINGKISSLSDSIDKLDDKLALMRDSYAVSVKRVNAAREGSMSKLAFIFSSDSFFQAYRRMRYLREFSKWRDRKSGEIKVVQDSLTMRKSELARLQEQKGESLKKMSVARSQLASKQQATSILVEELKKENTSLRRVLREKEEQARALDQELDRLIAEEQRRREEEERRLAEERRKAEERRIAEERRKAEEQRLEQERILAEQKKAEETAAASKKKDKKQQKKKDDKSGKKVDSKKPVTTSPDKTVAEAKPTPAPSEKKSGATSAGFNKAEDSRKLTGSFESNKGRLLFPVSGRYKIVRPFGRHQHPDLPHVTTDNGGIDIEVAPGGNARAVYEGTVSAIFRQPGFNTIVMVRHGNYLTIYANLSDIMVKNGDKLKQGQTIGRVYSDPDDDNRSILHFELRKEKEKLNPSVWVK